MNLKFKLETLTDRQVFIVGLIAAVILELITLWLRFGMHLESTRDTQLIGVLTYGIRIHHGYMGIVLGLMAWTFLANQSTMRNLAYIGAIGLFVSDMVHHFLVLWPVTGSPQFDLVY